jgi:hypothetical protein
VVGNQGVVGVGGVVGVAVAVAEALAEELLVAVPEVVAAASRACGVAAGALAERATAPPAATTARLTPTAVRAGHDQRGVRSGLRSGKDGIAKLQTWGKRSTPILM